MKSYLHTLSCQCMIIDMEDKELQRIRAYIDALPGIELVGVCESLGDARMVMQKFPKVSLLFAGWNGQDGRGGNLVQRLRDSFECIVLIGDKQKYALDAFQTNCDHFLLSPVEHQAFHLAMGSLLKKAIYRHHFKRQ